MVQIIKQTPIKKMLTDRKLQSFVWKRNVGKAPWGNVQLSWNFTDILFSIRATLPKLVFWYRCTSLGFDFCINLHRSRVELPWLPVSSRVSLISLGGHIGHILRPSWMFSISTCIKINSSKISDKLDKSVVIRVQKWKRKCQKQTMFAQTIKKIIKNLKRNV